MPATYSLSIGQSTESLRKPDINSVLLDLPDNTQKLISPKDVRDAFLSAWSTSAFKQTIGISQIEYIGIDSGNPENRDIKQKIFLGKRNFAGVDIMNNSLLSSSDNDIYIFNTKPDDVSNDITRIAILSGTNSNLYAYAPYIQARTTDSIQNLDFVNPNGPININSLTGRVAINGISFPTNEENTSAVNGMMLKYSGTYPNGVLKWSSSEVTLANIGSPNTPTNIYGSPSNLNGYSLEFVDDSIVPKTIGGVEIGSSFSSGSFNNQNWPLSEVIRKLLYPYVPPTLSIDVTNSVTGTIYGDVGLTSSGIFNYKIKRYSLDITQYNIIGTTYSGLSYSASAGSELSVTFSYPLYKATAGTVSYVLSASDIPIGYPAGYSHSATASICFVNPFFYSFNSTLYDNIGVGSLVTSSNKILQPYLGQSQSIEANYSGDGYIYFLIPNAYGLLSKILDPNGFVLHDSTNLTYSSFTYSIPILPIGHEHYGVYRVYRTIATCSYIGSENFKFIF